MKHTLCGTDQSVLKGERSTCTNSRRHGWGEEEVCMTGIFLHEEQWRFQTGKPVGCGL